MERIGEIENEKAARCLICNAPITVPNEPGMEWVCGDCAEEGEDERIPLEELFD